MVLEVLHYPNPILKRKSKEVACFDENLHSFLDDMYETMLAKEGVGLAAIQVGREIRALIINLAREDKNQYKEDLFEMINPQILNKSGEIFFTEGCLSVPNFYEDVLRFNEVEIEYCNRLGEKQHLKAEGYLAVAIQHEMDHLDGILFIDRLSLLKRKKFQKEFKKLLKEEGR